MIARVHRFGCWMAFAAIPGCASASLPHVKDGPPPPDEDPDAMAAVFAYAGAQGRRTEALGATTTGAARAGAEVDVASQRMLLGGSLHGALGGGSAPEVFASGDLHAAGRIGARDQPNAVFVRVGAEGAHFGNAQLVRTRLDLPRVLVGWHLFDHDTFLQVAAEGRVAVVADSRASGDVRRPFALAASPGLSARFVGSRVRAEALFLYTASRFAGSETTVQGSACWTPWGPLLACVEAAYVYQTAYKSIVPPAAVPSLEASTLTLVLGVGTVKNGWVSAQASD